MCGIYAKIYVGIFKYFVEPHYFRAERKNDDRNGKVGRGSNGPGCLFCVSFFLSLKITLKNSTWF